MQIIVDAVTRLVVATAHSKPHRQLFLERLAAQEAVSAILVSGIFGNAFRLDHGRYQNVNG